MTENKGNLISREALKKAIIEHRDDYVEDNFFWSKLFNIIDNAPTVDALPTPNWYKVYEDVKATFERPQGEITEEDIQNAIKAGYENGYSMAQAKYQRPQGEWIEDGYRNLPCVCSYCGEEGNRTNFCANCGAEMVGGES